MRPPRNGRCKVRGQSDTVAIARRDIGMIADQLWEGGEAMNTGLSLVSELIERRGRLKGQHLSALAAVAARLRKDNDIHAQAHYKGLEYGIDYGLIHLDFLVDLAKQEGF